jgi:single-stranded DNA-binding protein
MNSCILMAEIIQDPQLRYTSDNQMAIAEMTVQFEALRPGDPAETLKVIGWGNLAQDIQANYHTGDRVIIEGRLSMNTFERPEGFKEKRAELVAQRIHRINADLETIGSLEPNMAASPSSSPAPNPAPRSKPVEPTSPYTTGGADNNFDDIPF